MGTKIPLNLVHLVSNRSEITIRKLCQVGEFPHSKEPIGRGIYRYIIDIDDLAKLPGVIVNMDEVDRLAHRPIMTPQAELDRLHSEIAKLRTQLDEMAHQTVQDDRHAAPGDEAVQLHYLSRLARQVDYNAPLSKRAASTLVEWHGGNFQTAAKWTIPAEHLINARAFLTWLPDHVLSARWRLHACEHVACPCHNLDAYP